MSEGGKTSAKRETFLAIPSLSISYLTVSYINFSIAKLTKTRLTAHQQHSSK